MSSEYEARAALQAADSPKQTTGAMEVSNALLSALEEFAVYFGIDEGAALKALTDHLTTPERSAILR